MLDARLNIHCCLVPPPAANDPVVLPVRRSRDPSWDEFFFG